MSSFKLVAPFFYNPEKSKQAITEGNDVELSCKLLFGFEDTNITIKWSRRTGNDNNTDQVITKGKVGRGCQMRKPSFFYQRNKMFKNEGVMIWRI